MPRDRTVVILVGFASYSDAEGASSPGGGDFGQGRLRRRRNGGLRHGQQWQKDLHRKRESHPEPR
jgi:hypothetical protein